MSGEAKERSTWVLRLETVESHPVTKALGWFLAIVTTLASVATCFQIYVDINDRRDEREARQQERIDRAWTRINQRAGGQTGKGWALNVLMSTKSDISTLNLSCEVAGVYDDKEKECISSPEYWGLETGKEENKINIMGDMVNMFNFSSIKDANFYNSNFDSTFMNQSDNYDNSYFIDSSFVGSFLSFDSEEEGAVIQESDLSYALMRSQHRFTLLKNNVSGTVFLWSLDATEVFGESGNWAWADEPPRSATDTGAVVLDGIDAIQLCDPKFRIPRAKTRRVGYSGIQIVDDVLGKVPALKTKPPEDSECQAISGARARELYPSSYAAWEGRGGGSFSRPLK